MNVSTGAGVPLESACSTTHQFDTTLTLIALLVAQGSGLAHGLTGLRRIIPQNVWEKLVLSHKADRILSLETVHKNQKINTVDPEKHRFKLYWSTYITDFY